MSPHRKCNQISSFTFYWQLKTLQNSNCKVYLEVSHPMLEPWLCSGYRSTWVDIHFRPSNPLTYTYNSNSTQLKAFTNLNIKVYAGATISIARSFIASNQLSLPTTPRWCTCHVIVVNDKSLTLDKLKCTLPLTQD